MNLQGPEIPEDDLFVGVKTCEKFHKERGNITRMLVKTM
jgi:hypothetical protein